MIYFTADTHFGHTDILNFSGRPFDSLHEMNQVLMMNWNRVVQQRDEIYILGDFMAHGRREEIQDFVQRLNGKKYLILGNHDEASECEGLFEWVRHYHVLETGGYKLVLFHFPVMEWDGFYDWKCFHLYGHLHSRKVLKAKLAPHLKTLTCLNSFNVGVDHNAFKPVSLDEVLGAIKARSQSNMLW
jgi:calcineurin-like phosphoesterase family protein